MAIPTSSRCDDPRMPWTVLIVDDHAGFRRFARELLEADGFTVVGEVADGEDGARRRRHALLPELVLLDVACCQVFDGFAVAERLAGGGSPAERSCCTSSRAAARIRWSGSARPTARGLRLARTTSPERPSRRLRRSRAMSCPSRRSRSLTLAAVPVDRCRGAPRRIRARVVSESRTFAGPGDRRLRSDRDTAHRLGGASPAIGSARSRPRSDLSRRHRRPVRTGMPRSRSRSRRGRSPPFMLRHRRCTCSSRSRAAGCRRGSNASVVVFAYIATVRPLRRRGRCSRDTLPRLRGLSHESPLRRGHPRAGRRHCHVVATVLIAVGLLLRDDCARDSDTGAMREPGVPPRASTRSSPSGLATVSLLAIRRRAKPWPRRSRGRELCARGRRCSSSFRSGFLPVCCRVGSIERVKVDLAVKGVLQRATARPARSRFAHRDAASLRGHGDAESLVSSDA